MNRRSGAHLARYLPGVRIRPFDPGRRDSVALVVGGQRFLRDPEEAVYAVLARFLPAPRAYGHGLAELASDVTAAAFAS